MVVNLQLNKKGGPPHLKKLHVYRPDKEVRDNVDEILWEELTRV